MSALTRAHRRGPDVPAEEEGRKIMAKKLTREEEVVKRDPQIALSLKRRLKESAKSVKKEEDWLLEERKLSELQLRKRMTI